MSSGWAPRPRPLWQELLGSSVVAAVVTVLLGTIAGQLVLAHYQTRVRREEQAAAEYRHFLTEQDEMVKRTFTLVGAKLFASDALLALASGRFDDEHIVATDRPIVQQQRRRLLERHGEVLEQWSREKEPAALLAAYSGPAVTSAWRALVEAADTYGHCAEAAYAAFLANRKKTTGNQTCADRRAVVSSATQAFAASLERSRDDRKPAID